MNLIVKHEFDYATNRFVFTYEDGVKHWITVEALSELLQKSTEQEAKT